MSGYSRLSFQARPFSAQEWGLIISHCARFSYPPYPPIASQSISRDVPVIRARALQFSKPVFRGVSEAARYCTHRATTASSGGLCEQEGHLAAPSPSCKGRASCANTGDQQAAAPPVLRAGSRLSARLFRFSESRQADALAPRVRPLRHSRKPPFAKRGPSLAVREA